MAPDAKDGSPSLRQREAEAIVRCHALEGKTRREVLRMLGPRYHGDTWLLGTADPLMGSADILQIDFGAGGRVERVSGPAR
jgi:hypothetical protein